MHVGHDTTTEALPWELRQAILWTVGPEYKLFMSAVCREWRDLVAGMPRLKPQSIITELIGKGHYDLIAKVFGISVEAAQNYPLLIVKHKSAKYSHVLAAVESEEPNIYRWWYMYADIYVGVGKCELLYCVGFDSMKKVFSRTTSIPFAELIKDLHPVITFEDHYVALSNCPDASKVEAKFDWLMSFQQPVCVNFRDLLWAKDIRGLKIIMSLWKKHYEVPPPVEYQDLISTAVFLRRPIDDLQWMYSSGFKFDKPSIDRMVQQHMMGTYGDCVDEHRKIAMFTYCDDVRKWLAGL